MSQQTFHSTREDALSQAQVTAESSCPHKMATIFIIGPGRYAVDAYLEGDERNNEVLLIVLANGTQIDPVDYRKRKVA